MAASQPHPGPDLVLAALLAGRAMDDEIARRLTRDGYDMRSSDRAVFALLSIGAATPTALARSLGITQQATSKALADLRLRGYVDSEPNPRDARTRPTGLSAEGRRLITADRQHRTALQDEMAEGLGAAHIDVARTTLNGVMTVFGDRLPASSLPRCTWRSASAVLSLSASALGLPGARRCSSSAALR
jgi:DNA-binding MarR family transcriptional regulator